MAERLLESVRFVGKLVHCDLSVHTLVHHRWGRAYLLLELAACARARARLEASKVGLHTRMGSSLHELLPDLGTMTSDPSRYVLVEKLSTHTIFASKMDGREVEDVVNVICRKRGVEADKPFAASAIGSWQELWQFIVC